jgi:hypothetical protein
MTGGKRNRGLAVLQSYRLLAKNPNPSREELHLVTIMGWCLEMVQIQTTVFDDSFLCVRYGNVQTGSALSAFPSHVLQLRWVHTCNVTAYRNAVTLQETDTIRSYELNFHPVPRGVTVSCERYILVFPVCYGSPSDVCR